MARMNIDILGISELKYTQMSEFNSDEHYIYYCGQRIAQKKWSSPHSEQETNQSQKPQINLGLFPRQTIQYHRNPSLWPISNAEEGTRPTRLSITKTKKEMLLSSQGTGMQKQESRDT